MKQRCSIARALYYGSELLLMDEPFKSLDYGIRHKMIADLLAIHQKEKNTILFVTHDIEEALSVADVIFVCQKNQMRLADTIDLHDKSELTPVKKQELKDGILRIITEQS